ncbi:MAG: hypothetical protein VXZ35_01265, partial [Pseudomonadota bacterium]|nr:hypothetical protein [Pseudomonadota bacterium]
DPKTYLFCFISDFVGSVLKVARKKKAEHHWIQKFSLRVRLVIFNVFFFIKKRVILPRKG